MTTKYDSIIKMCNQIASNVGGHLSTEQAADKTLNHIYLFWAKSMKENLVDYYRNDGELLNEISSLAIEKMIKEG
jgi:formate dehydrogenase subunit delta